MSYDNALEAAGAEVLEFEAFGSYQGDWWAKVKVNGQVGWINGSFGSCSGCDAFQSEFGWDDEGCDDHKWVHEADRKNCEACKVIHATYGKRLADFGREYLAGLMSQDEAETKAKENLEWDMDASEMLDFIKEHKVE